MSEEELCRNALSVNAISEAMRRASLNMTSGELRTDAGGVISHWILGWDFGFMSLFGVIGVGGVIVNDSLVLMDRYNKLRSENKMLPAIAATSAATRQRFRAVFLTSATTILALAPLLYERSDELMFLVPFVVSMVGELIFSGLFILFMLPSLVMMVEAGRE